MGDVQTLNGAVAPHELGATLAHEHLFWLTAEIGTDFPERSWRDGRDTGIAEAHAALQRVAASGIRTIVDCTCIGGRDVRAAAAAAEGTGVHVVMATGLYTYDHLPPFYRLRPPTRDAAGRLHDVIADLFVEDVTVGIQGTGIRAGVIKIATDLPGVTPNVDRILRAAARAHRETGAPITTHSSWQNRSGLAQQDVLAQEGVDLSRVVIGHAGDSDDLDYLRRILDRGSYVGADRFGYHRDGEPALSQRVETVARLCELGYAEQIVLAHDACAYTDWYEPDNAVFPPTSVWNWNHVPDIAVPALRERGVTEDQVDAMLVRAPRRFLSTNEGY